MFENGNFCGAFMRIVLWRTASAAAPSAFAVFAAFAFLITLFAVPAQAAETVDDLFLYFAHEWTYENRMGNLDDGDESVREVSEKGGESLKKIIIAAEPRFGHLGEYWELRALYDVAEPKLTPELQSSKLYSGQQNDWINSDCLKRAVELNKTRGAALVLAGQIEQAEAYDVDVDMETMDDPSSNPIPPEADLLYVKALAKAANAEPENAWYAIEIASQYAHLGMWDEAMKEFERAGKCENYISIQTFPYSYCQKVLTGEAGLSETLEGLTALERYEFLMAFGFGSKFAFTNFIRIKDSFREAIVGVSLGASPEKTYTTLHRAACVMGGSDGSDLLDGLVAATLIQICLADIRKFYRGDPDFELAWLALKSELGIIKEATRVGNLVFGFQQNLLSDILSILAVEGFIPAESKLFEIVENYKNIREQTPPDNEDLDAKNAYNMAVYGSIQAALFLNDNYAPYEKQILEQTVRPAFERLKGLDYSNPGEWYENWLVEKKFVRED